MAWMAEESAPPHVVVMAAAFTSSSTTFPTRRSTLTSVARANGRVAADLLAEARPLKDRSDHPLRIVGSPTTVGQLLAAALVEYVSDLQPRTGFDLKRPLKALMRRFSDETVKGE